MIGCERVAVFSVSVPDVLLDQVDAFIEARGYAGRSELVRAAVRDLMNREAEVEGPGDRTATLTLIYPEGSERKVSEVRHDFSDVVRSMMHGHTEAACVELFMLSGDGGRIRRFVDSLRALRDTQLVAATYTDIPAAVEGGSHGPSDGHGRAHRQGQGHGRREGHGRGHRH